MAYIDPVADKESLGLVNGVTQARADAASAMVDGYLRRPEGLLHVVDDLGRPSYMSGLKPTGTWTLGGDIAPGESVVCSVAGIDKDMIGDLMGEVLVIDRDTETMEAVYVSGYSNNQITLASVKFAHTASAKMERGLVILEERKLPKSRPTIQLRRPGVAKVISIAGRYGLPRHGDLIRGDYLNTSPMIVNMAVLGPPAWQPVNISQATIDSTTGMVWVPASILAVYYTDVRLRYVAGWTLDTLPDAVRIATAAIANAMAMSSDVLMGGALREAKAGDQSLRSAAPQRVGNPRTGGADSPYLTPEARAMLDPYRARSFA
ncbi:hypothetical protein [Methylosinus sp. PW1]|uniref:hypothetical protein n=1 Tax=Methylosinus sp. PW1 TaxID=107636 RepID=UPI00056671DA|nr:hypothetical protein [Methylosinus sp. PW1]